MKIKSLLVVLMSTGFTCVNAYCCIDGEWVEFSRFTASDGKEYINYVCSISDCSDTDVKEAE